MNVTFTFHFLQRQYFLEPFNENKMMKNWLISEMLLYLLYFLVVGTPIILYVISVFFLTMKRELSIALSMVMVLMIHPIFSLLFGISIKSLSQLIWPRKRKGKRTVCERLFTLSINVYLSMIGVVIFYLMSMDVSLGKEYQFKDQSYYKCMCDELKQKKLSDQCSNEDNDDVQNKFVGFPINNFVLSFSIVSLACHVLHSLVIAIPSPIPMADFILGSKQSNETEGQETADSMEMTSPDSRHSTHEPKDSKCKRGWTVCFKILCLVLALAVVGCLGAMPYFHFSFGKSLSTTNSGCPTQSDDKCTFPFVFESVTYYGCSKVDNKVIGFRGEGNHSAKAWCAIDAKENGEGAKSYEICEDTCPGGTRKSYLLYCINIILDY